MPASFVPVSAFMSLQKTGIEEVISRTYDHYTFADDPAFRQSFVDATSAETVTRGGGIGREFVVRRLYAFGLAGFVQPGHTLGDFPAYGDPARAFGNRMLVQDTQTGIPNAFEGAVPRSVRLTVPLFSTLNNIGFTLDEAQANAMDATVMNYMRIKLNGLSKNMAQNAQLAFYLDSAKQYRIYRIGDAAGSTVTISTTDRTITFQPDNLATTRIQTGTPVDILKGTAPPVRINESSSVRVRAFVASVDPLANKVVIQIEQSTTLLSDADFASIFSASNLGSTSYVVFANAWTSGAGFRNFSGINAWLKPGDASGSTNTEANTLLGSSLAISESGLGGAINVNVHPEFKSYSKDLSGDVLTENGLRLHLDAWNRLARPLGFMIDTMITSTGVMRAMENSKIGRETIERAGRMNSLSDQGAADEIQFTHNGKKYTFAFSEMIDSGTVYGYRRAGNWTRVTAPQLPGSRRQPEAPSYVPAELLAPIFNNGFASAPVLNASGQYTGAIQFPSRTMMNYMPIKQIPGMILTGCQDSRLYSDA